MRRSVADFTLKGYVSNGKDPSKVCSPPPDHLSKTDLHRPLYCKQCAGYVLVVERLQSAMADQHGNITWIESTNG